MKTQSKGPSQPSSPKPEALDEKITHLTEEVAKKANLYKVPALIVLVLVVAVMAIVTLTSTLGDQAEGELSESVYLLFEKNDDGEFKKSAAEIRAEAPALAKTLEGEKIEPIFASRYAAWLFEQNEGNDRQQALSIISDALGRHEGDLILTIANDELTQVQEASAGFTLPPIPEPDPPPLLTPVGTEGETPPAGTGEETGAGETGTGGSETGGTATEGTPTEDGTPTETVTPPTDQPTGGR